MSETKHWKGIPMLKVIYLEVIYLDDWFDLETSSHVLLVKYQGVTFCPNNSNIILRFVLFSL